ncbi:MAG TPA: pyridoxamine 5'-phosphate oxidase family protein [Chloroflexia bacterium]|jgi:nitroimidazol reductase NimA-like FMN-containing flavoprotein (pyridoxamine 5'-phosphate oxidase superfamily)
MLQHESEIEHIEPQADRPQMPEGYGIPKTTEGLLPWNHVSEMMSVGMNYWIGTTRPDGRPHSVPVWGVWVGERFYFEGGPDTRRGRNLEANPAVVVHLERGDDVVILEGTAEQLENPDASLAEQLAGAFGAKYGPKYNYNPKPDNWQEGGLYIVHPGVVFAWTKFPEDCTRWRFGSSSTP